MSSFEWMELQTLASEITASRARLATARTNKDRALARALEEEITEAEQRRTRLLAQITNQLAATGTPEPAVPPAASESDEPETAAAAPAAVVEAAPAGNDAEPPVPVVAKRAVPPASEATGRSVDGWDQLSPADLERAMCAVDARRAAMLARHAEELQALAADEAQLDALEQAIEAFTRKFNLPRSGGAVVQLDAERELRLQSTG